MTHLPTLEKLRDVLGGTVYQHPPGKNNIKFLWMWNVGAKKATDVLVAVLPYLLTKREEAVLGLSFAEVSGNVVGGGGRVPPELLAVREKMYWDMKMLKKAEFVPKDYVRKT